MNTLMADIASAHPTIQVSVPRIWEKVHARVHEKLDRIPSCLHRHRRRPSRSGMFEMGSCPVFLGRPTTAVGRDAIFSSTKCDFTS